jgi:hypothetical protein
VLQVNQQACRSPKCRLFQLMAVMQHIADALMAASSVRNRGKLQRLQRKSIPATAAPLQLTLNQNVPQSFTAQTKARPKTCHKTPPCMPQIGYRCSTGAQTHPVQGARKLHCNTPLQEPDHPSCLARPVPRRLSTQHNADTHLDLATAQTKALTLQAALMTKCASPETGTRNQLPPESDCSLTVVQSPSGPVNECHPTAAPLLRSKSEPPTQHN